MTSTTQGTRKYFIIDFDSTFVKVEALDELCRIALVGKDNAESILEQVRYTTAMGMDGNLSFPSSLAKRLALFSATRTHVNELIDFLQKQISNSVIRNVDCFRDHADDIYIISGGFRDYIVPIVAMYGIAEDHVLANTFQYDNEQNIIGFDKDNYLAKERGKVRQLEALKLNGDVIVIGDGMTDYHIREDGFASQFLVFTENVRRESVVERSDREICNFDGVFDGF